MSRYQAKLLGKEPSAAALRRALVAALLSMGCGSFPNPHIPYVEHYRQLPNQASQDWLSGATLSRAPLVAGSVHTPTTLSALPTQFHARYPSAVNYAPLWARERDVAAFLHEDVASAVSRRLAAHAAKTKLLPGPDPAILQFQYHASAHLELRRFRAVLFDARASNLGDASWGDDEFAPFRKAFLLSADRFETRSFRLVTGYFGLHCAHELVGRQNRDRVSTKVDWLVALTNGEDRVIAQAYIGASSVQWKCPIHDEQWEELLDTLADQLILSLIMPQARSD